MSGFVTSYAVEWVTISKMAEISGYTEKGIRRKIEDGIWRQGQHWKYGPDNRILVSIKEYNKWTTQPPSRASKRGRTRYVSVSS